MRSVEKRQGFTLVEMLVAVALTILIMGIIAIAFQKSLDTFRTLRSVSLLQEKLKSAHLVLQRDLESNHFGGSATSTSGPLLSNQRLDLAGWKPPSQGYFSILSGGPGTVQYINEGTDLEGVPSTRAVTHSLAFTVYLNPPINQSGFPQDTDYYYAQSQIPQLNMLNDPNFNFGGTFASRWAEIFYFLVPSQIANGQQQMYTLYRRQRLLAPTGSAVPWNAGNEASFPNISYNFASQMVNTPATVTPRANRFDSTASGTPSTTSFPTPCPEGGLIHRTFTLNEISGGANVPYAGDDILMTNVLSFEVEANWDSYNNMQPVPTPLQGNLDYPFATLPASLINPNFQQNNYHLFDTWSQLDGAGTNWNLAHSPVLNNGFLDAAGNRPPLRFRIRSIQIRLRVWDFNSQIARQVTYIFDV